MNTKISDKIIYFDILVLITFMRCIIIKKLHSVHKSFFEKFKVHKNSMLISSF